MIVTYKKLPLNIRKAYHKTQIADPREQKPVTRIIGAYSLWQKPDSYKQKAIIHAIKPTRRKK
ncbi:MAG: hypothetical protein N4A72_02380 [Bacteroidales bacterium]|jgi:hypothetical protein|nr:hypothetical protein [Bacteroidales bacterium]